MEFKGTKGEWVIGNTNTYKYWVDVSSDKGIIARTFYGDAEPIVNKKEAESNAKLIASAPYLLEALQGFVNLKDLILPDSDVSIEHEGEAQAVFSAIQKAQKAIEKALL